MDVPFSSISVRSSRERKAWTLPVYSGARRGLAVCCALAVGALGAGTAFQERPRFARSSVARRTGTGGPSSSARRLPDALKFANGLLRQKKYDLAAEEYERFANSGAKGRTWMTLDSGSPTRGSIKGTFARLGGPLTSSSRVRRTDPRRLTARYRLGELAYLLGDLPAARQSLEEFSAATADHPGLEMALTYLGDTCFGLQDFPQARVAYQRSLAAYPSGRLAERAKYGLGRTLAALGERDRALALMQELTKQANPEWIDRAWLQIGLIRKSAGQFAEAVEAFTTLERVAPRSTLRPEARLQRALALVRLERDAGGRSALADRWRPTEPPAQGARAALELATIELERNQPDAAMTTLESGLKRFPESPLLPAMHFRAAEVLQKQNRLEEAQARFERVVESNPNDPWADDAQRAGRPGGARPGRSGGRPAPGRYVRGPVSPEPARAGGPADRGPRRRAGKGSTTRPSPCSNHSSTPPADAAKKPAPRCRPP